MNRAQQRKGRLRQLRSWLLLALLLLAAWGLGVWNEAPEEVSVKGQKLVVADGDSFSIGTRKLRLDGIDAAEYRQICKDAAGNDWECGKLSRTALDRSLRQPGLTCTAAATDQYARAIATCSTIAATDIAAGQVLGGMAVSNEFYGIRSYGDEEDSARAAKRGLWSGEFLRPDEWRSANGR